MILGKEELEQAYQYIVVRLREDGFYPLSDVVSGKAKGPAEEPIKSPSVSPVVPPEQAKAVSETMSENIHVPSFHTIKSHTMDWTQGGKPSN